MMSTTVTGQSGVRSRIDELLGGLAPYRVVIPRADEVHAYLVHHPDGLPLLVPIAARTQMLLDPDAPPAFPVVAHRAYPWRQGACVRRRSATHARAPLA